MHITDLNECLSELPEISVLEYFRGRPTASPFRHTGENAVDSSSADFIGPILVDDRGIEYVVSAPVPQTVYIGHVLTETEGRVCRVTRPNKTCEFQNMTRSADVPADLRKALLAFVTSQLMPVAA